MSRTKSEHLEAVSVIVPTLNAAASLPGTIAALRQPPAPVLDIVVVDGGSTDDTCMIAERLGARVFRVPPSRGGQCAAGAAAARHPWLLFLHADTRLAAGWAEAAGGAIRRGKAGYFRFTMDDPAPQARRLERWVVWRCRVLSLPYGDQGLLLHRDLYATVGGHRPIVLMEDVDLVRRLGRSRLVPLDAAAVTSAERWRREGWWRRSARNLTCLALWFAGVPPRWIVRLYG